ncbi:MAG: hypothetical protein AB7F22_28230 [Reyranella sp.]
MAVKKLCRQMSKPYLPLRSFGMSSFAAALRGPLVADLQRKTSAAAS